MVQPLSSFVVNLDVEEYQDVLKEFRCDCGYRDCNKRISGYIFGSSKLLAKFCVQLCSFKSLKDFFKTNRVSYFILPYSVAIIEFT